MNFWSGNSDHYVDYEHTWPVLMQYMRIKFKKISDVSTIGSDGISNLFDGSILNNESLSGYILEDTSSDRSLISSLSGYIEEDDTIISELSSEDNSALEEVDRSSESVSTSGYVKTINSQESEYRC